MDKKEIYEWLEKVIKTCSNDFHFEGIDRLIELFYDKFKDEAMTNELKLLRMQVWNDIHLIL
jgi:hypothetical protein